VPVCFDDLSFGSGESVNHHPGWWESTGIGPFSRVHTPPLCGCETDALPFNRPLSPPSQQHLDPPNLFPLKSIVRPTPAKGKVCGPGGGGVRERTHHRSCWCSRRVGVGVGVGVGGHNHTLPPTSRRPQKRNVGVAKEREGIECPSTAIMLVGGWVHAGGIARQGVAVRGLSWVSTEVASG
jgi:hypothetical protein